MKKVRLLGKYDVFRPRINRSLDYTKFCTQSLKTTRAEFNNHNLKIRRQIKNLWETTLPSVVVHEKINTKDDWKRVRNELLNVGYQVTLTTIDSIIIDFCIRCKNYGLAYSYIKFLKDEHINPNLATIGKYFKLYYLRHHNEPLKSNTEVDILNLYNEVRQNYKVLDATTCENIMHALSITQHWKECLKLLDEIKITCKPSSTAYSLASAGAFKFNEYDLAWKLLEEAIDEHRIPLDISYLAYLQKCEETVSIQEFLKKLEVLFEFFKLHHIKCAKNVAERISSICKNIKLKSKVVNISQSGICPNCREKLEKFVLTKQEFENLKTSIYEKVIVGKNVFYKTTPEEVENFQKFITNMPKYDVVIDGLNVAYSMGTKQSPLMLSAMVAIVVKHFVNQNKRVLVLGRTHMRKWPTRNWTYITQNADSFLAQNLSQDDPYLLYCALHSGVNTIVVSKDLMRAHLFKLKNPKLRLQFSQWLIQNQLQLQHINVTEEKVFFKYPLPYLEIAQKQGKNWHVPYEENENESRWLCISNNSN